MKEIDIDSWKRKAHYLFFSRMDYPQFNICFDVDITEFLAKVKGLGLPFYYSMIHASTKAADGVEEFRYRARDGKVVLHESLTPAFTDMDRDSGLFRMVAVGMNDDIARFCAAAREKSAAQTEPFVASDFIGRDDYIYYTSIPWISFTHISHTISLNRNDSVPRLSWGKYYERDGRILLPYSVQVHHAFADGIHIARFKDALEHILSR